MARKPSPKPVPADLVFARVMSKLVIDAARNGDELGRLNGADAQAQRLHELALETQVIVNLVSVPGSLQYKALHVTGSAATGPVANRPRDASAFIVSDIWTHVGFRLAYGDQDTDVTFRNALLKAAPDGVERLARWLTPAGQVLAQRLRRGPQGDRHAHIELVALDRYHATFEALDEPV